jgi:hypothetical protein
VFGETRCLLGFDIVASWGAAVLRPSACSDEIFVAFWRNAE